MSKNAGESVEESVASQADLEEVVPELSDEPDSEPMDGAEYQDVEVQDREGIERPETDRHPEE